MVSILLFVIMRLLFEIYNKTISYAACLFYSFCIFWLFLTFINKNIRIKEKICIINFILLICIAVNFAPYYGNKNYNYFQL